LDTLIDVGGYKLHFNIIKGKGTPILFEAGLGDDGTIWDNILMPIHNVTGATIITYDRAGFGKSEVNLEEKDISKHGINNTINELEIALKKLDYFKDFILVGHSYGGSYSKLFASRHPDKIKYVVMVDSNPVSVITDDMNPEPMEKDDENLGFYYWSHTVRKSNKLLKETEFPSSIPVIDLEAEFLYTKNELIIRRFRDAHNKFVNEANNRSKIRATGSGHYIFLDNPSLVINTIIKAYSSIQSKSQKFEILERALQNSIELSVESKKVEIENLHSENDLNEWGYKLIQDNELEKALEVFKLNTILYPQSWNAYDSYGEALYASNKTGEAIKMYKKSIALNPENENGKEMIKKIEK
jgi:pimeloyl-ACP methyl ester carboxylesterase|tara:strand:+ start:98 stop:1165 length:1068 start_codon:yes stop_codon:yes gene_type:complete